LPALSAISRLPCCFQHLLTVSVAQGNGCAGTGLQQLFFQGIVIFKFKH